MTAILNLPSLPSVRDLCPATLRALPIEAAQLQKLAAIRESDREHELGRMMYAHLYDETCRARSVARLRSHVDLALQEHWQANRERFLARALSDYERAAVIERAATCAAGSDELGRDVSADVTRMYARALADGMPPVGLVTSYSAPPPWRSGTRSSPDAPLLLGPSRQVETGSHPTDSTLGGLRKMGLK